MRFKVSILHGEVNEYHKKNNDKEAMTNDFQFSLAAFLIVASETSFFGYSDRWYYNGTKWHDEYDLPLGKPLGLATRSPGTSVWTREFASGTKVQINVANQKSSIQWASK